MWMCVFKCLHLYLFYTLNLRSVFLFVPRIMWPLVYLPGWGISTCSCCFYPCDRLRLLQRQSGLAWRSCCAELGEQLNNLGDEWAVKSFCRRRPTVSAGAPYVIATSVTVFLPSDAKPLSPGSSLLLHSCFFFSLAISWFKQRGRFSAWLLWNWIILEKKIFLVGGEVVNHELKMRPELCNCSVVLALNNKSWITSYFYRCHSQHILLQYKNTTYFCLGFRLLSSQISLPV